MTAPLPKAVHVGARRYAIVADQVALDRAQVKLRADLNGCTNNEQLVITLDATNHADVVKETLLHEVLHTITEYTGVDDDLGADDEEKVVNRLAPVLLDVLRRNPKLVAYLTDTDA